MYGRAEYAGELVVNRLLKRVPAVEVGQFGKVSILNRCDVYVLDVPENLGVGRGVIAGINLNGGRRFPAKKSLDVRI